MTDVLEEPYGKPPPAKRQMIDRGVASPSRVSKATRTVVHRSASRAATTTGTTTGTRASAAATYAPTEEELVNLRTWHAQIRARFPKMVFYFESIPDEQRSKLAKQVGRLGAVSTPEHAVPLLEMSENSLCSLSRSARRNSSPSTSHTLSRPGRSRPRSQRKNVKSFPLPKKRTSSPRRSTHPCSIGTSTLRGESSSTTPSQAVNLRSRVKTIPSGEPRHALMSWTKLGRWGRRYGPWKSCRISWRLRSIQNGI